MGQAAASAEFDIVALVVDRCVVAEQLAALGDFGRPAGYPDRSTAGNLRDLPDGRADRAGGGRYHHGIAGARKPDIQQPKIGGDPVDAGDTERERKRKVVFPDLSRDGGRPDGGEFLPAEHTHHFVARPKVGMGRLQHLTGGE